MNAAKPVTTLFIGPLLGRGGFGEVYLATGHDGRRLALKVLRADVDRGSQAVARLRDEFRAMRAFKHQNIPCVHDIVTVDDRIALLTDYIDGIDLADAIARRPPLPHSAAIEVIAQLASLLASTPGTLVHRDIKPSNIRISRDGRAYLLDFGIAWTDAFVRDAHTASSALVGSPSYLAPERFLGRDPSPADDIFALGCVLYETLTEERLLADQTLASLAGLAARPERFRALLDARLARLPTSLDARVVHCIRSMTALDPRERPTAIQVVSALGDTEPQEVASVLADWCEQLTDLQPPQARGAWTGTTLQARTLVQPSNADANAILRRLAPLWIGGLAGLALGIGTLAITRTHTPTTFPSPVPHTVPTTAATRSVPVTPPTPVTKPEPSHPSHNARPRVMAPTRTSTTTIEPSTVPEAPPAQPATASVRADPDTPVPITLIAGSDRFVLPARVPPGRYEISAPPRPGAPPRTSGSIDLVAGDVIVIRCALGLCRTAD